MSNALATVLVLVLVLLGELIFRRIPGAGGLLYNISGTLGGIIWILAGAFLVWGGAYLLGGIIIVIGVNIHRSNFRIASNTLRGGRQTLNG